MTCEMVLANGENGLELTPIEETVSIDVVPLGQGNVIIPATVRFISTTRQGGIPTRLLRIRLPTEKNGLTYAQVRFECTPFVRYEWKGKTVYGDWSSCAVRNMTDADDPIFSRLTLRDRARITRAGKAAQSFREAPKRS